MGLLDKLFGIAKQAVNETTKKTVTEMINNKVKNVTISTLPTNLDELKSMPQASLKDEFEVAALCVATLCNYENNPEMTFAMIDYLKGPSPLSPSEKQFITDRLRGKQYKTFSFFNGTSPTNDYTPTQPLTVSVKTDIYSYKNEGYVTLNLTSSGADSSRPITLRKKPSTGQWFVWQISFLSDIRIPASQDDWR